jgi:hypothetical protein
MSPEADPVDPVRTTFKDSGKAYGPKDEEVWRVAAGHQRGKGL